MRKLALIGVPVLVDAGALGFWLQGGCHVTTENAYVKADITQIASEVPGRILEVRIRDHSIVTAGELLVTSADGKGIVMRRTAADPAPKAHRTKGDKASQKRMATVGAVYTVDRYVRSPEQVVAALFRDAPESSRDRPRPQHKQPWNRPACR